MLGWEQLAEVEGDVRSFWLTIGADPDDPPDIPTACEQAMGHAPAFVPLRQEARLQPVEGGYQPQIRRGTPAARARWLAGHEMGEFFYKLINYDQPDIDEKCDAFGAAIVCPAAAFKAAVRRLGHRVHTLADEFGTTQSVALLRLGEVVGRSVMLLRPGGPIARGEPFEWPTTSTLVRALTEGRSAVHPLRIKDEPNRWGLMARR